MTWQSKLWKHVPESLAHAFIGWNSFPLKLSNGYVDQKMSSTEVSRKWVKF